MLGVFKKVFSFNIQRESKDVKKENRSQYKHNDIELKAKASSDELGVKVEQKNGTIEYSKWDEIVKISLITTDQGPFVDDVFLALFKEEKRCLIPSEGEGYNEVYEKVSKFEGFDFAKVIEAMSSTLNKEFICWEKK
ncbi:MAG TPA: hypothetical protein VIK78_02005 [Ruminiclostridium sp.]